MMISKRFTFAVLAIHFTFSATAQLNGNYSINSGLPTGGTNFASFSEFATSINTSGVSGNVTATVTPGSGPYNEQVVFTNIAGAGPSATVTLEGSGETLSAITTSTDRHVVRLADIQYFTINNLKVEWNPASTGGFYGIHIYNSGHNITISNCSVDLAGTNSTLYGAYIASGSTTSILDSGDFHDISIVSDTAVGGGYGASVFGTATNLAANILISGNVFYDFHSNGVYLRETDGAVVSSNQFDKRTTNVTSVNAIQVAQNANINARVYNNFIQVSQGSNGTVTFRGIYLFNGTGHKVYNNVIHDVRLTSGNFTGIEVRTAGTAPEIYYNTISIDHASTTTGNLYGIKEELSNTNSVLRNNLISITQTTSGTKAGLVIGASGVVTSAFNTNYNLIWVPNGNVAIKNGTVPILYPSLSDWQTASTQDANSVSLNPVFISGSLSIPTHALADNLGISIAGITTDVLGVTRSGTPDLGAYEFSSTSGIIGILPDQSPAIFPNPFSDELRIVCNINGNCEIVLYNAIGEIQLRRSFINSLLLDTQSLPPGIYLYDVRGRNELIKCGKVFKQ